MPYRKCQQRVTQNLLYCLVGDVGGTASSELTSLHSQLHDYQDANASSDLIGALLQRGEKLREAMVMSADEDNDVDESGGMGSIIERLVEYMAVALELLKAMFFVLLLLFWLLQKSRIGWQHQLYWGIFYIIFFPLNLAISYPVTMLICYTVVHRNSPPGKLFKAILTSDEPGVDDSVTIESMFLHNNKAVDLVLGEEEMHYLEESPGSSPDSSIVSESGDPLYDDTLLKDLFYTTPVSYDLVLSMFLYCGTWRT